MITCTLLCWADAYGNEPRRAAPDRPSVATPAKALATPSKPDRYFPKPAQFKHLKHVMIDPGHGGDNLGAVGFYGTREKALTLEISRKIASFLRRNSSIRVSLTRHDDRAVKLRDRPRWANARGADALISVHCNSNPDPRIHGMEVWFLSADTSVKVTHEIVRREEGIAEPGPQALLPWSVDGVLSEMRYAVAHRRSEILAHSLADGLRRGRPHVRFRGVRQAPFGVLKEARMAAVVLEVGYLSNRREARQLLESKTHLNLARSVLFGLIRMDSAMVAQARGRKGAAKR